MSVWKSNFFLQTGLPESLPKPPEPVVDEQLEEDLELHAGDRRRRGVGSRGKDKVPRKTRGPIVFNFFEAMRTLETREEAGDGNVRLTTADIHLEYYALTQQQRAYWEFMHELWLVFKIQEKVADWPYLGTKKRRHRKQQLLHKFYFLKDAEQQQLVRDHLARRWEKENYDCVRETCTTDSMRCLVDIRKDLRLLLAKVDRALAPRNPDASEPDAASPAEEPCI
jgi:hypothetical protein